MTATGGEPAHSAALLSETCKRIRRQPEILVPSIVTIALFLPEALGFLAFGWRFTPARVVLLAVSPAMLVSVARLLSAQRYRFVISDLFMPAALAWIIIALAETEGLAAALKSGGAFGLDFVGPYLVMRGFLRSRAQVHAIVRLFCILAAIAGLLGLADTLAGYHILRDQLAKLTGYAYYHPTLAGASDMHRLGLYRAQGVFAHPILFGAVMCYALILTVDLTGRARLVCRLGCGLGLFLSLSSAPWAALIVGLTLWCYLRLAPFPHRWRLMIGGGALLGTAFLLFTPDPLEFLFNHFLLESATGYFRLLTWRYAGHDVLQSPIFGIGMTENWPRPHWMSFSVDSLWLASAMRYGIPGSLLIALALVGALSLPVVTTRARAEIIAAREMRLGDAFAIVTFLIVFLGFTVNYWGASFMIVGLLAGIRAALGEIAAR